MGNGNDRRTMPGKRRGSGSRPACSGECTQLDHLTGRPTTVLGAADLAAAVAAGRESGRSLGNPGGADDAGMLPSLQMGAVRAARTTAQRERLRTSNRTSALRVPRLTLDDFGWKQSASERKQAFYNRDLFNPEASERLDYLDEGMEAVVYRDPANPGVVYKFFPRHDDFIGYGNAIEFRIDAEGSLRAASPQSNRILDLADKVALLDAFGLPTEIHAVSRETVVLKQREIALGAFKGEADTSRLGLTIFPMPPGLLGRKAKPASIDGSDDVIVEFEGAFWLIGDLHAKNYVTDVSGRVWIIDLLAGQIPAFTTENSPQLREYLESIAAANADAP